MDYEQNMMSLFGDPIEKEGLKLELGIHFPRYADFWLYHVYPNRRPGDSSKLRETIPAEIENLFNAHYSVWYQLTIAYRQLSMIDNPLVEIGDLLFHLATAIDLTELTFFLALELEAQLQGKTLIIEWTQDSYDEEMARFWKEEYTTGFRKFKEKFKPVSITLHNVSGLFSTYMPKNEAYKAFVSAANRIRPYRNQLAHNVSPVNLITAEGRVIPKPEYIQIYAGGHYSSVRPDRDHFAPVAQVISGLASDLVQQMNDLWEILLRVMTGIAVSPKYRDLIVPFQHSSPESGSIEMIRPAEGRYPPYTGGTIDFSSFQGGYFPKRPSGLQIAPDDDI